MLAQSTSVFTDALLRSVWDPTIGRWSYPLLADQLVEAIANDRSFALSLFFFFRPLIVSRLPSFVRVVPIYAFKRFQCIGSDVFLINNAVRANHEGLNAGHAILGRSSRQSESANHCALDDKIHLPHGRRGPLPFEHLKIVTVIWLWLRFLGVALFERFGDCLADRSAPSAVCVLPRETVMFTRCADDALRILVYF